MLPRKPRKFQWRLPAPPSDQPMPSRHSSSDISRLAVVIDDREFAHRSSHLSMKTEA